MDETDRALGARALTLLGIDEPATVRERLGGGSGARVYAVDVGSASAVLKVTADPPWRAAAVREVLVHENRALDGFRPRRLASASDDDLVVLLTERGGSLPAALSTADWSRIAHRLGQLHRVAATRARVALPHGDSAGSVEAWEQAGGGDAARIAVEHLDDARATSARAAAVLGHGDCHLGNLVLVADEPCWIDWQQAHPGPGFDDLVFCWQRAEFAGLQPPRDQMSLAYAAGRGVAADDELRCQLAAAELQLLLLAWPPFLAYGDADARSRMVVRLEALAHDSSWGRGTRAA